MVWYQASQLLGASSSDPVTVAALDTSRAPATACSRSFVAAPATVAAPGLSQSCVKTLLQRFQTLQLLLPGLRSAPATLQLACAMLMLLPGLWSLQLLLPSVCDVPATLQDAATAAPWSSQHSCNGLGRCNCCFLVCSTFLQRSWTLQLLLLGPCKTPAT